MASLSPLLHNFSADDVSQLSTFGESRTYVAGETLINEGEDNAHLYLILRGQVEVFKKSETGPQKLAEVGTTGALGEMSIFDPGPSSATVRAVTDVEVWRTTQDQLDRMHEIRPKVAFRLVSRICQVLAQRLRNLNEKFIDVT
jgi:CRP/FNR family transcriptional regulator, cyclic AMP receptor protein